MYAISLKLLKTKNFKWPLSLLLFFSIDITVDRHVINVRFLQKHVHIHQPAHPTKVICQEINRLRSKIKTVHTRIF